VKGERHKVKGASSNCRLPGVFAGFCKKIQVSLFDLFFFFAILQTSRVKKSRHACFLNPADPIIQYPMKRQKCSVLAALFLLCCYSASAQLPPVPGGSTSQSKPVIFGDLPGEMYLNLEKLDDLFDLEVGANVHVQVSREFMVHGVVVSKSKPGNTAAQTVVVNCTNRPGATLTLTRRLQADNTLAYRGRIISFRSSDAYDILPENGGYVLKKTELSRIMSE
jgi:hypothetical protein